MNIQFIKTQCCSCTAQCAVLVTSSTVLSLRVNSLNGTELNYQYFQEKLLLLNILTLNNLILFLISRLSLCYYLLFIYLCGTLCQHINNKNGIELNSFFVVCDAAAIVFFVEALMLFVLFLLLLLMLIFCFCWCCFCCCLGSC